MTPPGRIHEASKDLPSVVDPGLLNVQLVGVGDGDPLAVLELNLLGLELLICRRLESHASHDGGLVPGGVERDANVPGELLLGEAHLDHGVVDRPAGDLAGQLDVLLGGQAPYGTPVSQGPLCARQPLGLGLPAFGVQSPAHVARHHLAREAHVTSRVRSCAAAHGLVRFDQPRDRPGLANVYIAAVGGLGGGACGLDIVLLVEDGLAAQLCAAEALLNGERGGSFLGLFAFL